MAAERKSWAQAAWLSGALLVVPILGLVALLVLPDGVDDAPGSGVSTVGVRPERPQAPDRPEVPAPPPVVAPAAVPEPAEVPEPVAQTPERDEPEQPPSVLDPCCAALQERVDAEPTGVLMAALRACTNGRNFDDPEVAFRTVRRLLERQGYEVPQACE